MENFGANYLRRDIPKLILENNLYGVDLDERAAQLTQLSLYIKAWQLGGRRMNFPQHLNVVATAFTLPDFEQIEMALMLGNEWKGAEMDTLKMVWKDLQSAYKFGSLIRVEETFDRLLPGSADDMFANQWKAEMFSFKRIAIERLRHQLSTISSNPYSLSKVTDALTFLEILITEFDIAVANPPYTDSADFGAELKKFVDDNYKKPLKFNSNLYAAFIKRCCELTGDNGKVGMIHPMTFMYIKTFEDVRKYILEHTHINLFVEYGLSNLFGTVMVDPAFYVLEKGTSLSDSIFISLDQYTRTPEEKNKKSYCLEALQDIVAGNNNKHVYTLPQSKLKEIKSYPFIYWISDEFRKQFSSQTLEDVAKNAQGMSVSKGEKYQRFYWEVACDKIKTAIDDNRRWVNFTKGGPYNKWYGNNWLLVDWKDNGASLKNDKKAVIRNQKYYFKQGLTYSSSGSKGASFRIFPETYLFSGGGPAVIRNDGTPFDDYYMCAILNGNFASYMLECLNPTVNTTQGDMNRIPFAIPKPQVMAFVSKIAEQCVAIKKHLCTYSLIEQNYTQSPIALGIAPKDALLNYYNYENALLTQVLINEAVINETVFDIYQLNEHDRQMVIEKEGVPVGSLSVSTVAKASYQQWLSEQDDFKPHADVWAYIEQLPVKDNQTRIDDFDILYQSHNNWEEFCIRHEMNPIEVWYQAREQAVLPAQRSQTLAFELMVDVVRSILAKDDDGIVPIIESTGEEQLVMRIEAELNERGYQPAHMSAIFNLLGMPLDKFLLNRFFQQLGDHLNLFMYLPKTPFIWHISSGEHHALELYISIYQWSRDNLYRLKSVYAGNRDSALRDRLSALEGQTDANARMEAEEIRLLLRELAEFCVKIDDLLASGYDPKLDDGVGKNIAPLQKRKMLNCEVLNAGQMKKYLNADW